MSRARDQLWVVYSIDPDVHLKSGDLRRRLIEHARDPRALLREPDQQGVRTESPFERMSCSVWSMPVIASNHSGLLVPTALTLSLRAYHRRLAVECDGERWHTPEQLQRDMERQAILERVGWLFTRIRGGHFFRDSDTAMAPVFTKLNDLGIEPLGTGSSQPTTSDAEQRVQRIRRRAQALREQWS